MNKDIYIWMAIGMTVALAGTNDGEFKRIMRWFTLIIVLIDMSIYFN
jgi:hypothetical protein